MSQKTAAIEQAVKFSKKCSECGLRNFPGDARCSRCEAELARGGKNKAAKPIEVSVDSAQPGPAKVRRLAILATALVVLFGLVLFSVRQDLQGPREVLAEVSVAQPETSQTGEPESKSGDEDVRSQESAKQVLIRLRSFQRTARTNMRYEEYDQMLTQLEADMNSILPTVVGHKPSDQNLRQEVAAALRDYSAARNWWKTTIKNSNVLDDSDRVERLQVEWSSAQTHLDNAEKLLSQ
jgi:hypothetical protein